MKLAIIPALALLSSTIAAPGAVDHLPSNMSPRAAINEAEIFSFQTPASCSILSCISVIGEAICIADAIDNDNYKAVLKCAKKKDLCNCAGCFSALGDFLEKWGIC